MICPTLPEESGVKPHYAAELPGLDPERWAEEYGDALFGFAAARVRDRAVAQDLVQETFLAALRTSASFAGRSSERAWLFGILRNKLADHYRLQNREIATADLEAPLPEKQGAFGTSGLGKEGWVMLHRARMGLRRCLEVHWFGNKQKDE